MKHLTSLLKRGVSALSSVSASNHKTENTHHVTEKLFAIELWINVYSNVY